MQSWSALPPFDACGSDSDDSKVEDEVVAREYMRLQESSPIDVEEDDIEELDLLSSLSAFIEDENADIGSEGELEADDENWQSSEEAAVSYPRSVVTFIFISLIL